MNDTSWHIHRDKLLSNMGRSLTNIFAAHLLKITNKNYFFLPHIFPKMTKLTPLLKNCLKFWNFYSLVQLINDKL